MRIHQYKKNSLSAKKKSRFYLKLFVLTVFLFIFAVGALYLIIFSQIFRINKISVSGTKEVKTDAIAKIAKEILDGFVLNKIPIDNPILLPEQEIRQSILDIFPKIKGVILTKRLKDHTLVINVSEREPAAIWCRVLPQESPAISSSSPETIQAPEQLNLPSPESCFFIDENGFIFNSAPILSGGAVPTVYEEGAQPLNIKGKVSNPKSLEFILAAKKELANVNLNLTDFVIKSQSLGDLEILTPEGWVIYLDITHPADIQINALKRVLQEEIKEKRSRLEYIDLRVLNRAYYKLK